MSFVTLQNRYEEEESGHFPVPPYLLFPLEGHCRGKGKETGHFSVPPWLLLPLEVLIQRRSQNQSTLTGNDLER